VGGHSQKKEPRMRRSLSPALNFWKVPYPNVKHSEAKVIMKLNIWRFTRHRKGRDIALFL
jgi:hypothetical protein